MNEIITDIDKLRDVALDQHGYVTTAQAEEAGVSRPMLSYLVGSSRVERPVRGIYRVPQVPPTEHDAAHLAILWAGEGAVLSHDTALAAWDVCDVNPDRIHVAVPRSRRISKAGVGGVVLHRADVEPRRVRWWEQMPVVDLPTAIGQCVDRGLPSHLVEQAIENGERRGLLRECEARALEKKLEERNAG